MTTTEESHSSVPGKVRVLTLLEQLQPIIEPQLMDTQCGFWVLAVVVVVCGGDHTHTHTPCIDHYIKSPPHATTTTIQCKLQNVLMPCACLHIC